MPFLTAHVTNKENLGIGMGDLGYFLEYLIEGI
jgi:hypothetical protein